MKRILTCPHCVTVRTINSTLSPELGEVVGEAKLLAGMWTFPAIRQTMAALFLLIASILLSSGWPVEALSNSSLTPTATTRNGTYAGRYIPEWDQDVFLGMPYAQPPLGNLRFRWPEALNESFPGVRDASQYGFSCMQYQGSPWGSFNISEDCLNINVIRPRGVPQEPLPVLVWIFG